MILRGKIISLCNYLAHIGSRFFRYDWIRVSPEKKTNPNPLILSSCFSLAQLVHDFFTIICQENRQSANSKMPCKKNRICFLRSASSIRGSISASAERKNRGMMGITHKRNATVEDKKISMAAASAINGSRRKSLGGRTSLGGFGVCLCYGPLLINTDHFLSLRMICV